MQTFRIFFYFFSDAFFLFFFCFLALGGGVILLWGQVLVAQRSTPTEKRFRDRKRVGT